MSKSIVRWCAEECARQKSGELSVANMYEAWAFAYRFTQKPGHPRTRVITEDVILELGRLVEPKLNAKGYRKIPAVFANGNQAAPWNTVSEAMARLVELGNPIEEPQQCLGFTVTYPEFYQAFQKIHPFVDGNGRVGAILYNWNNLNKPKTPPNFF